MFFFALFWNFCYFCPTLSEYNVGKKPVVTSLVLKTYSNLFKLASNMSSKAISAKWSKNFQNFPICLPRILRSTCSDQNAVSSFRSPCTHYVFFLTRSWCEAHAYFTNFCSLDSTRILVWLSYQPCFKKASVFLIIWKKYDFRVLVQTCNQLSIPILERWREVLFWLILWCNCSRKHYVRNFVVQSKTKISHLLSQWLFIRTLTLWIKTMKAKPLKHCWFYSQPKNWEIWIKRLSVERTTRQKVEFLIYSSAPNINSTDWK